MNNTLKTVLVLIALTFVGCNRQSRPEGLPELFLTEVKISQEGKGVPGAFVRLVPENANSPWNCGGTTDANGIAKMRVNGEYDGAPIGEYKVVVSKTESDRANPAGSSLSNLDAPPPKKSGTYDLIDPSLGLPSKTTLKLSVVKGKNSIDLDVGPAVHIKQNVP